MGTPAQADRYHALDALRAAMMLAVVVLHAAILFSGVPAGRMVFRFADPDTGPEFFWLAVLLQSVSMPAFFLTAGFFAAMLAARRGARAMLVNRLRRITLPFVLFWPPLYGLTLAGILFGCSVADEITVPRADDAGAVLRHIGTATATGTPFPEALTLNWPRPDEQFVRVGTVDETESGPVVWAFRGKGAEPVAAAWVAVRFVPVGMGILPRPDTHHLIHLWFLWVLTLLVLAAAVLTPVADRLPTDWIGRQLGSFWFPLVAAVPLAAAFAWYQLPVLPPPGQLAVPLATILGYGAFFATGALLWRHRDRLPAVGRHWLAHLVVGAVAWVAGFALTPVAAWHNAQPNAAATWARVGASLCAAVGHWELVWGCVGLFNQYASGDVRWVRYLSDASYWVYLVHLPVVLWVAAALIPVPMTRAVKFPIVLAAGVGLPLITYHLWIRQSWIGVLLNGPGSRRTSNCTDCMGGKPSSGTPKMPMSPGLPSRTY